jgi:F-type H+-transporting ATPase subunit gamma
MKVVASTKLTRAQRAMQTSRTYGQTSNTVFESAETKFIESDKKTLIVVCSSDKGLCGGIHSGMSRKVRKMLAEDPNCELAVIGEKCKAQLSRSNGKNFVLSFAGAGKDIPTFADAATRSSSSPPTTPPSRLCTTSSSTLEATRPPSRRLSPRRPLPSLVC